LSVTKINILAGTSTRGLPPAVKLEFHDFTFTVLLLLQTPTKQTYPFMFNFSQGRALNDTKTFSMNSRSPPNFVYFVSCSFIKNLVALLVLPYNSEYNIQKF
jgi:hypothetical protein